MKSFLYALQFLTIIPVKAGDAIDRNIRGAIACFPLVGLLIGLVLAGAGCLMSFLNFGQLPMNTILLILLAFLTGGLHLDGLADTFDGMAGGKDRSEILRIMRDPHIGTMGTLSIILAVMLELALLSGIDITLKVRSLLLLCILSRWSMVLAMFLFPYARGEGKAQGFFKNIDSKNFILASVVTLFLAMVLWQLKGILIIGIVALSTYVTGKFVNGRIGGITGDTLGAVNEISQIIVLAGVYIMKEIGLWMI